MQLKADRQERRKGRVHFSVDEDRLRVELCHPVAQ